MATRTSSPRPTARSSTAPLPKGARIPQPELVVWVARAIVIGALAIFFASPTVLAWAQTNRSAPAAGGLLNALLSQPHPAASTSVREDADGTPHDPMAALLASAIITALTPRVVSGLGRIGVVGAYLMLAEAALATFGMWAQRRRMVRTPITYLLVRANQPSVSPASGRTPASGTPSGDQFFRAIQQAIPPGTRSERYWGSAPWVAFTLNGIPDRPIEMGVVVADANARRRAETVAALRAIIQGQLLGAQVDEAPDPLVSALTPEALAAWREYGLKLPAPYPLRFLDDIAGSDLLGPLASALAPRGVLRTETQIIVRPATGWALSSGWRGPLLLAVRWGGEDLLKPGRFSHHSWARALDANVPQHRRAASMPETSCDGARRRPSFSIHPRAPPEDHRALITLSGIVGIVAGVEGLGLKSPARLDQPDPGS